MKRTTIAISETTKTKLFKLGKMGDTPNSVIEQILIQNEQLKQEIQKLKVKPSSKKK
jgi:hypothetical protein